MKIKLIVASRLSEEDFFEKTAMGQSLKLCKPNFVQLCLFPKNTSGLPALYNQIIRESINDPAILVFVHDDIFLLDYFWCNKVYEGLRQFNILGLAGNRRRVSSQTSWAFIDSKGTWDEPENLSGIVGHGKNFASAVLTVFGEPRQRVKILDGLFIACQSDILLAKNLFFDERFDFHFYDLDFCRQAELKDLTCGTWDIAQIHQSGGNFLSEAWSESFNKYIDKWGD